MILFAHSEYLLLLLLVPFFPAAYGLARWLRRRRLRRFGDEALVRELMPSWSASKGWVRVVLFSLAFFFFAIGLARPQIGAKLSKKTKSKVILMLLSLAMFALGIRLILLGSAH